MYIIINRITVRQKMSDQKNKSLNTLEVDPCPCKLLKELVLKGKQGTEYYFLRIFALLRPINLLVQYLFTRMDLATFLHKLINTKMLLRVCSSSDFLSCLFFVFLSSGPVSPPTCGCLI